MGICMFNQISEAENDVDIKNTFAIEEVSDLLLQTGYRKPIEWTLCNEIFQITHRGGALW